MRRCGGHGHLTLNSQLLFSSLLINTELDEWFSEKVIEADNVLWFVLPLHDLETLMLSGQQDIVVEMHLALPSFYQWSRLSVGCKNRN